MFKAILLENSRRRKIYDFIKKNPGFHFRELHRRLGIPLSSLEHHVNYMIRNNIISKQKDGGFTRYFAKELSNDEKKLISALRHERLHEITTIVLERKEVKYQELMDFFGLPSSTLSYYLKYLVDYDVLKRDKIGYENVYSIKDRRVGKVLIMYMPGFLDRFVDKALNTFLEQDFKRGSKKS
jgi:predicted transcriptional regulator